MRFFSVNIKGKTPLDMGHGTDKCLKLSSQKKKEKGTDLYGVHTPTMAEPGVQGVCLWRPSWGEVCAKLAPELRASLLQ